MDLGPKSHLSQVTVNEYQHQSLKRDSSSPAELRMVQWTDTEAHTTQSSSGLVTGHTDMTQV